MAEKWPGDENRGRSGDHRRQMGSTLEKRFEAAGRDEDSGSMPEQSIPVLRLPQERPGYGSFSLSFTNKLSSVSKNEQHAVSNPYPSITPDIGGWRCVKPS